MYVCGPTVYDLLHVGNFRGPVVFNLVRNWLTFLGYQVEFIYNFTDVDDKIINRAKELGEDPDHLAQRYIQEFYEDFNSLKLTPHSANPRVSETIPEIIEMIQELICKGAAYATASSTGEGQDVWYRVKSFQEYGKLSKRKIDQLRSGVRIEADERKEDALDFALWKSAKLGERSWPSPWGAGRPGWHIECSAMSKKFLGEEIDIHGGGLDLLFPHHENEIAQSEGCHRKTFVRYWLHNNMIQFDGAKMSKSLGNVVKFRDFRNNYPPEVFKFLMLSSHYRSVVDFSDASIGQSIQALAKIYSGLKLADQIIGLARSLPDPKETFASFEVLGEKVIEAFNDDLNTSIVVREVFEALGRFNQVCQPILKNPARLPQFFSSELLESAIQFARFVRAVGQIMSLFQDNPEEFLENLDDALLKLKGLDRAQIEGLVEKRRALREQKRFLEADAIRRTLDELGVDVHDYAELTNKSDGATTGGNLPDQPKKNKRLWEFKK
jgi:cysteinyl-tRNA synthetase